LNVAVIPNKKPNAIDVSFVIFISWRPRAVEYGGWRPGKQG
jgi:hypothetical protein